MQVLRFLGRFFLWMIVLSLSAGILGVTGSLARIADFFLKEGAETQNQVYLRVLPQENKALSKDSILELKNIEGVTEVLPYFLPSGTVIGSVEYFGFNESMPIQIKGIPTDLGLISAAGAYKEEWASLTSERLPVLVPRRVVNIYNTAAPAQGWPELPAETFLGLPGLSLTIGERRFPVLIAGFDTEEIGFTVAAPAEKLYGIYESLQLSPQYTHIDVSYLEGLSRPALAQLRQSILNQGYQLATDSTESLQMRILQRVKFGLLFSGFLIFIGALALKILFSLSYYKSYIPRQKLIFLWGVKNAFLPIHVLAAFCFSLGAALLSWAFCFFFIIPAQQPIMQNLSTLGMRLPSLELSAETALTVGFYSGFLFFLSEAVSIGYFLFLTAHKEKFFI